MRHARLSVLGLCLAVVATASAQPVFRVGIDLVTFGVTVVDRRGELVTDLTAADFRLLEDGVPQTITHFARGLAQGEGPATHLGLMLDTSASMEKDLRLAHTAAIRFLNRVPEAEDITLVDFDTEVRVTRYPQSDFARLVERIRMGTAEGWTALYDALAVYLDGASRRDGRTVLVMYTDGADSRSRLRFSDILEMLRASDVTLYAIGLIEHAGSSRAQLRMRLEQMAEKTGGRAFFPSSIDDVEKAYDRVLAEIHGQYHLGYVSTNPARDGKWRRVAIEVKRRGVTVRTREGYFAPYESPGSRR